MKTVLTCTSWKKRIHLLVTTLDSIAKNSIIPDIIEINLSEEEFQNKENDLPTELVNYDKLNIRINWVGKNTTSFKKLIPTIIKYYEEDVNIITFDDDIIYEHNFIKKLLDASVENPDCIISNNICQGKFETQQCVNGRACLYKPKFFTSFLWEGLTDEIVNTREDDWWYSFVLYVTGTRIVKYIPIDMTLLENTSSKIYNTATTLKTLHTYLSKLIFDNNECMLNNITVLTCSYNNNTLTKHMIKSLFKQLNRKLPVVIMDNGNVMPCDDELKTNYTVIDNTNYKLTGDQHQISRNHCNSIDYALKHFIHTKYVMLCDNDVLFTPNIKSLLSNSTDADSIGEVGNTDGKRTRLLPFMSVFKTDIFKQINYYDANDCMNDVTSELTTDGFLAKDVSTGAVGNYGDTGTSVLKALINNNMKLIKLNIDDFIVHYASGSYDKHKSNNAMHWLQLYRVLWE